jgi:uncharacterized membrane protein YdjX (TVP38/TMEM64 family)
MAASTVSERSFFERLPRQALIRFLVFVGVVAAVGLIVRLTPLAQYLDKEHLVALVGQLKAAWWSPLLLLGLYLVCSPLGLPATPLMITGALVFGPSTGILYNFLGTIGGATLSFLLARHMGSELVRHVVGARLKRIERALSRRGFFNLVAVRFMPLPFPAVNFAMALAGIRFLPFVLSSAVGLAPTAILWTRFYGTFFEAAAGDRAGLAKEMGITLFLLGFVSLLPGLIHRRMRRHRYRKIRAARAARAHS